MVRLRPTVAPVPRIATIVAALRAQVGDWEASDDAELGEQR
jgi:hypothetical protein